MKPIHRGARHLDLVGRSPRRQQLRDRFRREDVLALFAGSQLKLPTPMRPRSWHERADTIRTAVLARDARERKIKVTQQGVDDEPRLVEALIDHRDAAQRPNRALGPVCSDDPPRGDRRVDIGASYVDSCAPTVEIGECHRFESEAHVDAGCHCRGAQVAFERRLVERDHRRVTQCADRAERQLDTDHSIALAVGEFAAGQLR